MPVNKSARRKIPSGGFVHAPLLFPICHRTRRARGACRARRTRCSRRTRHACCARRSGGTRGTCRARHARRTRCARCARRSGGTGTPRGTRGSGRTGRASATGTAAHVDRIRRPPNLHVRAHARAAPAYTASLVNCHSFSSEWRKDRAVYGQCTHCPYSIISCKDGGGA